MGHEVYIYAPRGEAGETKDNPYLFTSEAIRFIPSREYKWAIFPVFTIPKTNLGLDVIHVHSPISMGLAGLINAKRLAIPCIGHIHTLIPEFWRTFMDKLLPYFVPPVLSSIYDMLVRPLLNTTIDLSSFLMKNLTWRYWVEFFKRCDESIVPSKHTQEMCQKHGLETTLLPNGIDFSRFRQIQHYEAFEKRWKIEPEDRIALSVGRLSEEKNVEMVIQSARDVLRSTTNLKYMIVGDGPIHSKLEHLVEKSDISDAVIFTGYLNPNELDECYSRATFYINSSPIETQGLSVIEAMYLGCPILSVNAGAVPELFQNSAIGFLFENSKDDLTRVTLKLINDTEKIKTFRENSTKEAEKFDIRYNCEKLIQIYEKYHRSNR